MRANTNTMPFLFFLSLLNNVLGAKTDLANLSAWRTEVNQKLASLKTSIDKKSESDNKRDENISSLKNDVAGIQDMMDLMSIPESK